MSVELITAASPEVHEAMGRLVPQLSRSATPMSAADVERFLAQPGVHLFVFRPDQADADGQRLRDSHRRARLGRRRRR